MDIVWRVTEDDKASVNELLTQQRETEFFRFRKNQILKDPKPTVTRERFWRAMVGARLTTLAASGPGSRLVHFSMLSPFPLTYDTVKNQLSSRDYVHGTLTQHGIGTHRVRISEDLDRNLKILEDGEWASVLAQCNELIHLVPRHTEMKVADYISKIFFGFGPKQSRNLLLGLGLTRFESPIDSRVVDWLNEELDLPFDVTRSALSDNVFYKLILDGICELCAQCETLPCLLDAAIFVSQDGDVWTEDVLRVSYF